MNILVLNGSPKGDKSNTLKLTKAFLDGLNKDSKHHIDIISISEAHIEHCRGCFTCWTKTPGRCVIHDDMAELTEKYISADLILWSFPLYYFGMPSKIKAFLDRLLPTNLPFITVSSDRTSGHPPRYDLSHQHHVLISSCGFHSTKKNYDALLRQFEIIFGEHLTKILCPEGELLRVPQLSARVNEYLSHVKRAGEEFALQGSFSEETQSKLRELLYPPEVFVEMANASWDIHEPDKDGQSRDRSYNFIKQMAAVYNPQSYVKDIVIEIFFTDLDKVYQLMLGSERCIVKADGFVPYTTRIETSFELWLQISEGKVNGAEAMMKKQCKVLGDFDTMLKMDDYFGTATPALKNQNGPQKTNMNIFLFQWIILWVLLPISTVWSGVAGIAACSSVSLLNFKYRLTFYDRISGILVSMLSVMTLLSFDRTLIICLSYLLFGLLWLLSCLSKIPLSAHYSSNSYGGDAAFDNPLFIKTNRILTFAWGGLYLITAVNSYFLMNSPISQYTGLINSVVPALMGMVTVWFAKWYPAKVARG
jgi:multimeric flavodoxin WrbA/putative sterol carrier protein